MTTNHKQQKFIVSKFLGPEVQNLGVGRHSAPSEGSTGEYIPQLFQLWGLRASVPWLVATSL